MQTTTQFPVIDLTTIQSSHELSHGIIQSVINGDVNPLDLPVKKKLIEEALDVAMKNEEVKQVIIEEVQKYGKFASHLGAKIEVIEAGTKYHYENCNDSKLNELVWAAEAANNAVKDRQKFLQTIPVEGLDIIEESGEAVKIYPPYKTSVTSLKTTIK